MKTSAPGSRRRTAAVWRAKNNADTFKAMGTVDPRPDFDLDKADTDRAVKTTGEPTPGTNDLAVRGSRPFIHRQCNILTLYPGDVVGMGKTAGSAQFLKHGDHRRGFESPAWHSCANTRSPVAVEGGHNRRL